MMLWQEYKRADEGSGNGSVEKPPWFPYLELHNQDTAAAAPHAVDGGGANNVNVPAGMEVPQSSQPGTSTPCFTAPPPTTPATPRRARVHETATMQAAMLVSATIKDCHGDAMTRIEGLVREWMAQDLRLARERMTESAPPDVHRAPQDFSPPPPRGESAPAPETARTREDVGDGNTVTPAAEDVEIWAASPTIWYGAMSPLYNLSSSADSLKTRMSCALLGYPISSMPLHPLHVYMSAVHSTHHSRYTLDGRKLPRHLWKLFTGGESHPGGLEDGGELREKYVDQLVAESFGDAEQVFNPQSVSPLSYPRSVTAVLAVIVPAG
ncbi:unnamed protein product [Closterium sp. Yama58-4]|nr:unnamed protein product [Closterium sp. Yama58-4]